MAGVIVVFTCFWFFVYAPSRMQLEGIREEIVATEHKLAQVAAITRDAKNLNEGMQMLEKQYQALEGMFPAKEEEALRVVSLLAKEANIAVSSLRPQSREVFIGMDGEPAALEGKACQKMPVSLAMTCTYQELLNFVSALGAQSRAYTTIEGLRITRPPEGKRLDITMELNVYLLA